MAGQKSLGRKRSPKKLQTLAFELLAAILLDSDEEIDHADAQVICYVQSTLDNWNTHGRRKLVPIMKTEMRVQNIGECDEKVFSNRSNYPKRSNYTSVPIIEGRLYIIYVSMHVAHF